MVKSEFLREVGDTPKNRVWDFLIVHSDYDYSMRDIARFSGVGYTTLKEIWKLFKEQSIVIQTRVVGRAKMYKLNFSNPVVEKFTEYYWTVIESVIKRENNLNSSTQKVRLPLSIKN